MKRIILYYTLLPLLLVSVAACQTVDRNESYGKTLWPISSYNFGGMENFSARDQISLLRKSEYQGIILRVAKEVDFQMLPEFMKEADKFDDFKINAVFVRYNFDDPVEQREKWTEVVDHVAGKGIQLWVIFGKKVEGYDDIFVENKLREIVSYASPKKVEVILYPHSWCFFESAEEGMPFIEKINHDNLKIAFHLYHEIKAKNGDRIHEILDKIKHKLGAVTLSGTDSVADYESRRAMDISTIKPLGQGTFNVKQFTRELKKTGYTGYVGFMNFKFKESPEDYLAKSRGFWMDYVSEE